MILQFFASITFVAVFLSSCGSVSPVKDDSVLKVLMQTEWGNILTADGTNNIVPNGLAPGYVYSLKYEYFNEKGVYSTEISRIKLSAIENGAMIFDILPAKDVVAKERVIKIQNAIAYVARDAEFSLHSKEESCLFKLGKCEFARFNGKQDYIETQYKDGKWIKSSPGIGGKRRTEIYVFDKNGLILYKLNQFESSGTRITRIKE